MAHRREVNLYLYHDGNNDSFIDGIYLISLTKVFISVNEYADLSQTSSVPICTNKFVTTSFALASCSSPICIFSH